MALLVSSYGKFISIFDSVYLLIATFIYTGCCIFRIQWLAEFPEQVPGAANQLTAPQSFLCSDSRTRLSPCIFHLFMLSILCRIIYLRAFARQKASGRKHGEQLYQPSLSSPNLLLFSFLSSFSFVFMHSFCLSTFHFPLSMNLELTKNSQALCFVLSSAVCRFNNSQQHIFVRLHAAFSVYSFV